MTIYSIKFITHVENSFIIDNNNLYNSSEFYQSSGVSVTLKSGMQHVLNFRRDEKRFNIPIDTRIISSHKWGTIAFTLILQDQSLLDKTQIYTGDQERREPAMNFHKRREKHCSVQPLHISRTDNKVRIHLMFSVLIQQLSYIRFH